MRTADALNAEKECFVDAGVDSDRDIRVEALRWLRSWDTRAEGTIEVF